MKIMSINKNNASLNVEIAISALNEEANIGKLLQSIKEQKSVKFKLNKVLVISDGSTDRTINVVKEFQGLPIELIEHKKRAGKTMRMNELFSQSKANILVMFDADVILNSNTTIQELVDPIIGGRATLTGGRPVKIDTNKKFDKIMTVSMYLQDEVKLNLNHGDSLYSCHGRVVALHEDLFKRLDLPMPSTANDAYLYLFNKAHGGTFVFAPKATVLYKAPQTFKDFIKQQRRFSIAPQEQAKIFGKEVVNEYIIPKTLQTKILIKAFLRFHLFLLAYFYLRLVSATKPKSSAGKWDVSESTKTL